MILIASFFAPLLMLPVLLVPSRSVRDVAEILFFWPQWGLFPFSTHYRMSGVELASRPFGSWGFLGSLTFWSGIVFGNAVLTRRCSTRCSIVSFLGLATLGLALVHVCLRQLGYTLQLEGL